ncbi:putative RNA helicase, putative,ATP-dependent RNA helicase [Trypanosoma grayi]|uniref:putative RNA helicase, putative,ATP-dependent RNA helicase n=1 Tax=Trypanosoma grayi TaxID=71804 RepID=UPI0004F425B0|nr:putative RNA helicase, putative,ATP-dependent RNA helicase [Trypanosoma grayi]KEG14756.1 putative RNA helicase, putative,ATP-dependent RNA helicase [Trypanosoma grayi]
MDFFSALSRGAKFDAEKHGTAMKRFRSGNANKDLPVACGTSPLLCENGAEIPIPSRTLDLFGNSKSLTSMIDKVSTNENFPDNSSTITTTMAHKPLPTISMKRIKNIWRKNELEVEGVDVPHPIEHLSDLVRPPLSVDERLVTNLFERNHRIPTPVQMQAIPSLLSGRDVLACAPTGSGKTIAFLIPMFHRLKKPSPEAGVRALIITPTMELAEQIEREAFFLMKGQRWRLVQHGQSTRNKDIFVTTPGRVFSMMEKKLIDLSNIQYLVFDEGDRLWDSTTDNLQVVDSVLTACTSGEKVVALFTATLSAKIEAIARSVMSSDPIRIIVSGRASASKNVSQKLLFCGNELGKIVAMRNILREGINPPVLIFVQSIERTKELCEEIRCQGLHIAVMNSKMTHEERDDTMMNFRLGKIWVLITTDVLSRGIDFKNVGTVINFDIPTTVEAYIHRIGRCGRAGKTGTAITFFTEDDKERIPPIARAMKESGNFVEDWMLEIKSDRQTRRRLRRCTPQRMIVSTRKRMLVADQRMERQLRRLEHDATVAKDKDSNKSSV